MGNEKSSSIKLAEKNSAKLEDGIKNGLSDFQKAKLLHEFRMFYSLNNDNYLTWSDFEKARDFACKLNGWKKKARRYNYCTDMFKSIWNHLIEYSDANHDGTVSANEWLQMWEDMYRKIVKETGGEPPDIDHLPFWLHQYLNYRFRMLDRSENGCIEQKEFETVMMKYGVVCMEAKTAFQLLTDGNSVYFDFQRFCELSAQYYFSNDQKALGNCITGRFDFTDMNDVNYLNRSKSTDFAALDDSLPVVDDASESTENS